MEGIPCVSLEPPPPLPPLPPEEPEQPPKPPFADEEEEEEMLLREELLKSLANKRAFRAEVLLLFFECKPLDGNLDQDFNVTC